LLKWHLILVILEMETVEVNKVIITVEQIPIYWYGEFLGYREGFPTVEIIETTVEK
jgi:hypothetical protein